jgi:hypothetical protein
MPDSIHQTPIRLHLAVVCVQIMTVSPQSAAWLNNLPVQPSQKRVDSS